MLQSCDKCGRRYDDLDHWTFCPHDRFEVNPAALRPDWKARGEPPPGTPHPILDLIPQPQRVGPDEPGYVLLADLGFEHLPAPPPGRMYAHLVRVGTALKHGGREDGPIHLQINGVSATIPREQQVALLPQFVNVLEDSSATITRYGAVLTDFNGNTLDFLHSVRPSSTGLPGMLAVRWCIALKRAIRGARIKPRLTPEPPLRLER